MRSHAKASTAGSTQRQATGLGRIFRGVFATRGTSSRAKGSSALKARRARVSLAAFATCLLALLLTALPAGAAVPTIAATWSESVVRTEAIVKAEINPESQATTYHFEYGTSEAYGQSTAELAVGSDGSIHKVARFLEGLQPGTTYNYRVVATNTDGVSNGPNRTFTTYEVATLDTSCANQAFRYGPGAFLPDCRAYEMVSPLDKNGSDILAGDDFQGRAAYNQAALDGNKLTYSSYVPFGDTLSARGSNQYIATRGASDWTSHGINAPLGDTLTEDGGFPWFLYDFSNQFKFFTPDLSSGWMNDTNKTPLTTDAGEGYPNLYRRDNLAESYEALTIATPSPAAANSISEEYFPEVQGASNDFSKVVFAVQGKLTPDGANHIKDQIYMYSDGELHLVSVLPDGTAAPGRSNAGFSFVTSQTRSSFNNTISDDGSRVFWVMDEASQQDGVGNVYVRKNPDQEQSALSGGNECTEPAKACTVQIASISALWAASADGAKALTSSGLFEHETLSLHDVDAETSTVIAGEVRGVLGASDDLSYVYFTSDESLAAGATAGQPNVYLYHEDTYTHIGTLHPREARGRSTTPTSFPPVHDLMAHFHASRVTPDGRHVAFESIRSLTGYDNTDTVTGLPSLEVYIYDADADELTCVSCKPSGARPTGKALQYPWLASPNSPATVEKSGGGGNEPAPWRAAAWLQTIVHPLHPSRALSDDGTRLYFNAFDALVPEDTNGAQDVYQWEAQGKGSCDEPGGCISLISTGTSAKKSEFIDASEDGRDVFIETDSSIDPRDPGLIDIYDVRIGGGLQLPPPPPSPCIGDTCQSIPAAPNDPTPASASFKGAGDPAPRKARSRCRARTRKASKGKKGQAKHKKAKRCKRAKRGAGR